MTERGEEALALALGYVNQLMTAVGFAYKAAGVDEGEDEKVGLRLTQAPVLAKPVGVVRWVVGRGWPESLGDWFGGDPIVEDWTRFEPGSWSHQMASTGRPRPRPRLVVLAAGPVERDWQADEGRVVWALSLGEQGYDSSWPYRPPTRKLYVARHGGEYGIDRHRALAESLALRRVMRNLGVEK